MVTACVQVAEEHHQSVVIVVGPQNIEQIISYL
jgi:hypothetical protein